MVSLTQIEGKFEILEKLHEGGMGAIYRVQHRLLKEERVVKIMRHQLARDAQFRHRFLQEAQLAASLKHPNIAQIHDFTVDDGGTGFIVMEFIDGVSLKEILTASGALGLIPGLEVARQILRALGFLHRKGYIHRDISPDNVMLAQDVDGFPEVKVIDLGIAKKLGGAEGLTTTGHFLGKLRYSSPEHFGEKGAAGADERSDVYSFGLVFYELLTGTLAVRGNDLPSFSAGHLLRPPVPFEESDPEGRVPQALRELILRSLEKDPIKRFADAEVFAKELSVVHAEHPLSPDFDVLSLIGPAREKRRARLEQKAGSSTQIRLDRQFGVETTPAGRSLHGTRTRKTEIRLVQPNGPSTVEKEDTGVYQIQQPKGVVNEPPGPEFARTQRIDLSLHRPEPSVENPEPVETLATHELDPGMTLPSLETDPSPPAPMETETEAEPSIGGTYRFDQQQLAAWAKQRPAEGRPGIEFRPITDELPAEPIQPPPQQPSVTSGNPAARFTEESLNEGVSSGPRKRGVGEAVKEFAEPEVSVLPAVEPSRLSKHRSPAAEASQIPIVAPVGSRPTEGWAAHAGDLVLRLPFLENLGLDIHRLRALLSTLEHHRRALAGGLVGFAALVLILAVGLGGGGEERVSDPPPPEPLVVEPERREEPPPPELSSESQRHPELVAAGSCLDRGDLECVRLAVDTLNSGQLYLSEAESDELIVIERELELLETELAEANADLEALGRKLTISLAKGPVTDLRDAVDALRKLQEDDPESLEAYPEEVRVAFDEGKAIIIEYRRMWRHKQQKSHLEVIPQAQKMIEIYPPYTASAQKHRDEAVAAVESKASTLEKQGDLVGAVNLLRKLREVVPERKRVAEKIASIERLQKVDEAIEQVLASAEKAYAQRNPEKGLELLSGLKLGADSTYTADVNRLKNRLEKQFADMDRSAPVIALAPGQVLEYKRKETIRIQLTVFDEYRVDRVIAFARGGKKGSFQPVTVHQTSETVFVVEISPEVHDNKGDVAFYIEAVDPSGHTGGFGTKNRPQFVKRKGLF